MPLTISSAGGVQTSVLGSLQTKIVSYNVTANGSLATTTFFIADKPYVITGVRYVHKTQGTGTATLTVTKETGTTASGSGTAVITAPFACTTIANATTTAGTLVADQTILTLAPGDRLSATYAGTLTTLAGVVVSVSLVPGIDGDVANFYWTVNADISTAQTLFVAPRDMVVTGVRAVWATAFAASTTLTVTKDTGTTAAGGGTAILASTIAADGAINTVNTGALTATTATLALAPGDRLAIKLSATTTGVNLCVCVYFLPKIGEQVVSWQLGPNGQQQVAQYFCVADRDCEVIDAAFVFDVTAGGAAKLAVTIDKGTTAAGAGNIVQTDNSNAGFDVNATARTTQFMTAAARALRMVTANDRLGLKVSGAAQSISLVCCSVVVAPR